MFSRITGFPGGSDDKASACKVGDLGSIPESGRTPGEENGNLLQYSCLENSMDEGAWWATVHGVTKSRTWLRSFTFTSRIIRAKPFNPINCQLWISDKIFFNLTSYLASFKEGQTVHSKLWNKWLNHLHTFVYFVYS